jgi:hypothetical protein
MDDRIIPEEYICPITKDVMGDPVVASDGHTYERISIMQYLENEGKSPITRQEMNESQLLLLTIITIRTVIKNTKEIILKTNIMVKAFIILRMAISSTKGNGLKTSGMEKVLNIMAVMAKITRKSTKVFGPKANSNPAPFLTRKVLNFCLRI